MTSRCGRRFKLGPLVLVLFLVSSVLGAPLNTSELPPITATALVGDYSESDTNDPENPVDQDVEIQEDQSPIAAQALPQADMDIQFPVGDVKKDDNDSSVEDSSSTLPPSIDFVTKGFEPFVEQSPSSTIEGSVPTISEEPNEDDDIEEYEEDETDEEGQDEAAQWFEKLLRGNSSSNVRLSGRALDVGPMAADKTTTETPVGYVVVKWTLIGVIVLIPLILLPALFLFTRGKSDGAKDIDAVLSSIVQPILLYPTGPTQLDPCLVEGEPTGLVHKDGAGELHYLLTPNNAVVRQETGQLLHLPTGLLFNPVPSCTYDRVNRRVVVIHGQERFEREPNSNFVFDLQTGALYERCLALYYKEGSSSPDEGQWKLAHSPVQTNPQQLAIRRARPEELPADFLVTYRGLLAKWVQDKQAAGQAVDEPPQKQDQGFSPIFALKHAEELKLSSDKKPAVAKREQSNPLVVDQRDYSRRQPEDMALSPRGGEGDESLKLPVPPKPVASSRTPNAQPTVYEDAKSQFV